MELQGLSRQYIKATYGHSYTLSEIQKKYPYSNLPFDRKSPRKTDLIITYNPLVAMQMKKKNIKCLGWGVKTKDGNHAFLFLRDEKSPKQTEPLRFL